MKSTWKAHAKHGELTGRSDLPDSVYAFPAQRKEPLTDAPHVRKRPRPLRSGQDVSDDDRDLAFANIKAAGEHYGVEMTETDWRQLGRSPSTGRTEADRKASARWERRPVGRHEDGP